MTQRISDINNADDMALLWSMLPDDAVKITKHKYQDTCDLIWYDCGVSCESPFAINWHGKTEITRPIQEATDDDVGKICCFWNEDKDDKLCGILTCIREHVNNGTLKYILNFGDVEYKHCRRLTKQEIEELC